MLFIETSIFSKRATQLLADEAYGTLQSNLARDPMLGPVIPGSGGIRKIRWRSEESGKRGGIRVLYYWAVSEDTILLLFVFAKNEQDDLSPSQLRELANLVRTEFP